MTRAALASVATLLTGYLASVSGSYRMCYVIAAAACVVGFVSVLRLGGCRVLVS